MNKKMTKKEAIKKIKESPEFLNAAIVAFNSGKISAFLKEYGIDATEAEVKKFLQGKEDKLSKEDLNKIVGGYVVRPERPGCGIE